ncbi:MAG: N-formylglutamate amidohydrolase, partial [Pseudomonadota bacterium]|nr:N-formylglutamate amidohydrolase [Pseudomonadota bacterium]
MLQRAALLEDVPEEGAVRPAPPFDRSDPPAVLTPLVHASPHSGRLYPEALLAASALDAAAIRRSEDAHVDALLEGAPRSGGPLIAARYARAYVDLNRAPYELDPAMFEDELPPFAQGHVVGRTARAAAGLGSIARVVAEGQEIYRRKLTFAEARERIEAVHTPYHAALERMLTTARARFGAAL